MKKIILLFSVLILTGCSFIYRPDTEQGNIITPDMLAERRLGMTSQQVKHIMGNPVLAHSFDVNRWDYIYTYRKSTRPTDVKRFTLFFVNDHLQKITPEEKYKIPS
ncbi:MAG: outer membrane protein assembly factor BamE [Gammaproteobacteria bacterium]|nr:outer membrane protein assembly factor BamE [Gammaproteobacteria bacterium]